ncbi:hypothetical protein DUNSADRAFT_15958, partial [Dunaliella salina]
HICICQTLPLVPLLQAFTLELEIGVDDTTAVLNFSRPIKRLVLNCLDMESYVPDSFECLGRGTQGRLQAVEELCFQSWLMDADDCPTLDLDQMAMLIQTFCPSLRRLELEGCEIATDFGKLLQHFASPPKALPLQEVRIAGSIVDNLYVSFLLRGLALLWECLKVLSLDFMVELEQSEYDEDCYFVDPVDLRPLAKLRELRFLSIDIDAPVKHLAEVKQSCRRLRVRRTNVRAYRPAPSFRGPT